MGTLAMVTEAEDLKKMAYPSNSQTIETVITVYLSYEIKNIESSMWSNFNYTSISLLYDAS